MQLIESIYLLFDGLYSASLRNYLSGYDCASASFVAANVYSTIGLITLAIVLVVAFVYYKLLDPTTAKGTKWGISLIFCSLIAIVYSYWWVSRAESKGLIGQCLLTDDNGNTLINTADYLGLGLSNGIIALVLYVAVSFGMRYVSVNNRYIPF